MALFRMSAAFGLLLAIAPDQTLHAVRQAIGVAEGAPPLEAASPAEAAVAFCRSHPEICIDAARRAAAPVAKPAKP